MFTHMFVHYGMCVYLSVPLFHNWGGGQRLRMMGSNDIDVLVVLLASSHFPCREFSRVSAALVTSSCCVSCGTLVWAASPRPSWHIPRRRGYPHHRPTRLRSQTGRATCIGLLAWREYRPVNQKVHRERLGRCHRHAIHTLPPDTAHLTTLLSVRKASLPSPP